MDNLLCQFGLHYGGEEVWCKTAMKETCYQLFFNCRYVAELVMDENMEWVLASGVVLPVEVINHIGQRIERKYL